MRGKGWGRNFHCFNAGITPAYAGKSRLEYAVFPFVKDHPRLCGEKAYFNWFVPVAQGSPPPMRGKGLF